MVIAINETAAPSSNRIVFCDYGFLFEFVSKFGFRISNSGAGAPSGFKISSLKFVWDLSFWDLEILGVC
jgi:hypothetical protein